MIRGFLRRHNRAVTVVSVAAIGAFFVFPSKDVARGILIGGLLPIINFDAMQRHLASALSGSPGRARGRLFTTFLGRYGVLALGLALAFWLSRVTFYSAVGALLAMYIGLLVAMGCEARAALPAGPQGDGPSSAPDALERNRDHEHGVDQ